MLHHNYLAPHKEGNRDLLDLDGLNLHGPEINQ